MPIKTIETNDHLKEPSNESIPTPTTIDLENRICTECRALNIEPTDDIITEVKKYFSIGGDGFVIATGGHHFNTIREMLNHYIGDK